MPKKLVFVFHGTIALLLSTQMAVAQDIAFSLPEVETLSGRVIQLFVLMTFLSLAPAFAMVMTCFPFMVTVLAILRQGLGLQQSPPNMLIVSLALFMTYYVMEPVFQQSWQDGVRPAFEESLPLEQAIPAALAPFREFMTLRINQDTLEILADVRNLGTIENLEETNLSLMIPAFLLSEIERAFQIGFLIFLPFLIIDLVVAAILMSMGMMMVPPVIVSLPFKLAFFVVADGWALLTGALVRSYF